MKVIPFLFLLSFALGFSLNLPAQEPGGSGRNVDPFNPGSSRSEPPARVLDKASGRVDEIRLYPEALPKVVQSFVEQYTEAVQSKKGVPEEDTGAAALLVPTIIYGEGTARLEVEAPLRLVNIGAPDGLALIAAAAGCSLEPIQSPPQNGDEGPPRIIGYTFVAPSPGDDTLPTVRLQARDRMVVETAPRLPKREPDDLTGVGIALKQTDGKLTVAEVIPDTPAARSEVIKPGVRILRIANKPGEEVSVDGKELVDVVKMIRGEPDTNITLIVGNENESGKEVAVSLKREVLPVKKTDPSLFPKVITVDPLKGIVGSTYPASPATTTSGDDYITSRMTSVVRPPYVGVYAIGAILKKGGDEERLRELIAAALELADLPDGQEPTLSVHGQSETLIVKGTTEEHEIISQVIRAWKENAEIP